MLDVQYVPFFDWLPYYNIFAFFPQDKFFYIIPQCIENEYGTLLVFA